MESKKSIHDAAREGDILVLNKLLQENPSLLDDIAFGSSPAVSAIHVATKAGQLNFVHELMKHNNKLARELDKDGFRPLDIAAIMGNVAMMKELSRLDPGICLLQGKDRRTALHYAASKGKVELIDELVSTCPDCLKDVTFRQETALHLAIKDYQFDAFKVLIKWLEIHKLQSIIDWRDYDGNTVLHLAALKKQHESIELLFSNKDIYGKVDVNAKNSKGLTAADILDVMMESPDDLRSTQLMLQHASGNPLTNPLSQTKHQQSKTDHQSESKDWFKYFKFQMQRDSPSDTRNALLVVAALIATVTFQAGLTPPSGVSSKSDQQPTSGQNQVGSPPPPPSHNPVLISGFAAASAILGSHATSYLFLFSNSLGLTASLSIIIYLTGGFPFQRELLISIFAMMSTYGFSISSILREEKGQTQVTGYILLTVAFSLPFLLRWLPTCVKVIWKKCRGKFSEGNLLPLEN
ncbi:hypothetical protein ACH5RR_000459 [Cinchona calisaya]|uniref:PGG domain-containing protein n=1 Tax=Cinchona calisaya TaxID=153742 RepID=A0ABD3B1F1_9GENT